MFRKNPNRPSITIDLKRTPEGFRVVPNQSQNLFTIRRITRSMFRNDISSGNAPGQMLRQHPLVSSNLSNSPTHVTIPAFSKWFDIDSIHQIERDAFTEFFLPNVQQQSFSFGVKNGKLYKYYRNLIIGLWRDNSKRYLQFSLCRRNIPGDVGCILRIYGFLENWGLINFPSKEHHKGQVLAKPEAISCYVCGQSYMEEAYLANLDEVVFQVCDSCFHDECYPLEISKAEFRRVATKNYGAEDGKMMTPQQVVRMLEIVNNTNVPKDKQREVWFTVQKQFPQFSREDIMKNFLKVPLVYRMNSSIFENNQEATEQFQSGTDPLQQPSIFEDFQNPIMASIAMSHYYWKTDPERYPQLKEIFAAAESHARYLAQDQEYKIVELTKMLIEIFFSKLEFKSLFVFQYERLIEAEDESNRRILQSNLAENLKLNCRFIEKEEQQEQVRKANQEREINYLSFDQLL